MVLTFLLAALTIVVVPVHTVLALRSIRPGYKLITGGGILGAFGGGILAGLLFWRSSINLLMYFIICITVTGLLLTRGKPTELFDLDMIYGYDPTDVETTQHEAVVGKKQLRYLAFLLAEGLPVIVWVNTR
jgi:hypothetical protein